eukprot:TRINITY_DN3253_c0_g1_i1.p1 TRINITY_DN3253_c0_g1~~TRINITY_DN3253_c0_g1_i1.p1  ORF type:complete len:138 (-),score=25.08 TRINITY_DN3253_c0_g1_i1:346-759(-)
MQAVRKHFRPEFLNRLDDIVVFHPLTKKDLNQILQLNLARIGKRVVDRNITLSLSQPAIDFIINEAYTPAFGARPLRRFMDKAIGTQMSKMILGGTLNPDSHVELVTSSDNKSLQYRVTSTQAPQPADEAISPKAEL